MMLSVFKEARTSVAGTYRHSRSSWKFLQISIVAELESIRVNFLCMTPRNGLIYAKRLITSCEYSSGMSSSLKIRSNRAEKSLAYCESLLR